jgi:hypothetical protein
MARARHVKIGPFLVVLAMLAKHALAHGEPASEPSRVHGPSVPIDETQTLTFLPGSQLYPRYLADPRQPVMKALLVHVIETDTPGTRSPLYEFTLGGSYGIFRVHPEDEPEHGLQFGAHAGFIAQFDPKVRYDGIGWDGYYGVGLTHRAFDELATKLAYQHASAHISDEYVLKTGRKRVNYTREEVVLGIMVDPSRHARVYSEIAYAFHLGANELEPWRTELGLELRFRGLYAAVDITYWEEQSFRPTTTAQLGFLYERLGTGRRYGIFGQYERGRSKYGEFYRDRNQTIGGGYFVDL